MTLRVDISDRAEADVTNQYCWYIQNANRDLPRRLLEPPHE